MPSIFLISYSNIRNTCQTYLQGIEIGKFKEDDMPTHP